MTKEEAKEMGATHYAEHRDTYARVGRNGFIEVWMPSRNRFEEIPLFLKETILKPL